MNKLLAWFLLLPLWLSPRPPASAAATDAVVHAVLFHSPSCGHCHMVITETLPPLVEKYGEQLYIVGVDVSQPGGQGLFLEAIKYFNLGSAGVPFLVVGDVYLIGSVDIPAQFPSLIESYLTEGGVGWPEIPGLAEAMQAAEEAAAPTPKASPEAPAPSETTLVEPAPATETPAPIPVATPTSTAGLVLTGDLNLTPWERVALDPQGNGLAIVVLLSMLLSAAGGVAYLRRSSKAAPVPVPAWLILALCLVGLGVAGYLTHVETAHVEAVCGPVGDCNTVQQSKYAHLFGVLPIGVLGIVGYLLILLAWGITRLAKNRQWAAYASLAMLGMTTFGLLFSIYLTFLEPFVIGATCAWCVTSAIIITILFWLSVVLGRRHLPLVGSLVRNLVDRR